MPHLRLHFPPFNTLGAEKNPYKFGGKEYETANALHQYDFEARTLTPSVCLFTSPDPLAQENPWSNPYGFCSADPINRVDFTGLDDIYITQSGRIDRVDSTDDNTDTYYILDSKGNVLDNVSLTTDKGAISSINYQSEYGEYTVYETQGDKNGSNFFEFLADNTGVEYSVIQTGKNSNGANYVTTSHKSNQEVGSYSFLLTLSNSNRNVRTISHNHPGLTNPSGMDGRSGDVQFAHDINNLFKGQSIEYNVYMKDTKLYIPYNEFSKTSYYPRSETNDINSHTINGMYLRLNAKWLGKTNLKP